MRPWGLRHGSLGRNTGAVPSSKKAGASEVEGELDPRRAAARMLPILLLLSAAAPARAQWTWSECVTPGIKVVKCDAARCGQREVNAVVGEWSGHLETLRGRLALILGEAGKVSKEAGTKLERLAERLNSHSPRPAPVAACLKDRAALARQAFSDLQKVAKESLAATAQCRLPIGDPDFIKQAEQCEPSAGAAYVRYQGVLKTLKELDGRLADAAPCTQDVEDPGAVAAYAALVDQARAVVEEARVPLKPDWCSLGSASCQTEPEKAQAAAARLNSLAQNIEPFPKSLKVDPNRRSMLVDPIRHADQRTSHALELLSNPRPFDERSFNFLEAIRAMWQVQVNLGIGYVKWKTWSCLSCCIPLKVCYAKKGEPREDLSKNRCKPGK